MLIFPYQCLHSKQAGPGLLLSLPVLSRRAWGSSFYRGFFLWNEGGMRSRSLPECAGFAVGSFFCPDVDKKEIFMLDLNKATIDEQGGLLDQLAKVKDPRMRQ